MSSRPAAVLPTAATPPRLNERSRVFPCCVVACICLCTCLPLLLLLRSGGALSALNFEHIGPAVTARVTRPPSDEERAALAALLPPGVEIVALTLSKK